MQEYTDLHAGPNGLVYGFADRKLFFVFDPVKRAVVYQQNTEQQFGPTAYEQCPRVFIPAPEGQIYVLFNKGIARIDPATHGPTMVAKSPVSIEAGGDYLDGRIYFIRSSHICSYELPK